MKIWAFHFPSKNFDTSSLKRQRLPFQRLETMVRSQTQSIDKELLSLVNLDEDNIEDDPYIWVHVDQHFTKFRLSECHVTSQGMSDIYVRCVLF